MENTFDHDNLYELTISPKHVILLYEGVLLVIWNDNIVNKSIIDTDLIPKSVKRLGIVYNLQIIRMVTDKINDTKFALFPITIYTTEPLNEELKKEVLETSFTLLGKLPNSFTLLGKLSKMLY